MISAERQSLTSACMVIDIRRVGYLYCHVNSHAGTSATVILLTIMPVRLLINMCGRPWPCMPCHASGADATFAHENRARLQNNRLHCLRCHLSKMSLPTHPNAPEKSNFWTVNLLIGTSPLVGLRPAHTAEDPHTLFETALLHWRCIKYKDIVACRRV